MLLPTCNRADWLIESLESLLAQTRAPDQIIVINDGSIDDTAERLKAYLSRVTVISQENAGKSAALNAALPHATGDFIWIFDDDDIATPDALEVLLSLFGANPDADFAYGRHDRFSVAPNGRKRWLKTGYWCDCQPDDFLFESLLDMFVHQPAMLVKKSLLAQAGPFDETFLRSQDYEMLLRLARHGTPVSTDKVVFHQRIHDMPRRTGSKAIPATERILVWQQYDQMIMRNLYSNLHLGRYLSGGDSLTAPGGIRHALIRRGIVMARKNLWQFVAADFLQAAQMDDRPLSKAETADLRKTFLLKYDRDESVTSAEASRLFSKLGQISEVGAQMSRALARALVWRARRALQRGRPVLALRLLLLTLRLAVPLGPQYATVTTSSAKH